MFSSNAAKQLASAALQTGKTAAKDIGIKAGDVSKTVAIDAILVEKDAIKIIHTKITKWIMLWFHQKKLLRE